MTSILTVNHYIQEANSFIEDIKANESTYYVYTARPQPWANSSGGNDDSAVQVVNNSVGQVELEVFDDLLFGKLITDLDVSHVVPRYNWVANTVYAQYDHRDANLYSKNFFVVTTGQNDQYNVFKCIDNAGNAASTIKPTLQTTEGVFMTGDGYTWKYMYTVDAAANNKFTTAGYIPVSANLQVSGNAIPGTMDIIRVSNAGSGYQVYETGLIDSILDRFTIKLPNTSSSFDDYYSNSSIYLKSGFGAGQVREVASYDGTTKRITISDPVDTYIRLDFANSAFITGGDVGERVSQTIDTIGYTQSTGLFNQYSNVVQTDTGVTASVLTVNSSALGVSKFNKSQSFSVGLAVRDATDSGTLKTDKVNISNSSVLGLVVTLNSGSGYTANANVSIVSATGSGASANAQANSTGKIETINLITAGNNYVIEPFVTVSAPVAQTFNANTGVVGGTGEGSNNIILLATSGSFQAGDRVRYQVTVTNTAVGGLESNTIYFIQFSNSSAVALSNTANTSAGNRIALIPGNTETGHSLQGITATARILPLGLYATNTAAGAVFTTDYANGDFIRVGQDANRNVRRIASVNSTVIVVDRLFANTISSANAFKVSTALIPTSVTSSVANGTISNTNLNSIRLLIANTSVLGAQFIVGERVDFVTSANVSLNANGTIAYANSSSLFISNILGTWSAGQKVRGNSSNLLADVLSVDSKPNVTLKNPSGNFLTGQQVDFLSGTSNTGIANLVSITNLTEGTVEYEIGPTVKITGDGNGAIAYAVVNTQVGSGNTVSKVVVVNSGSRYTKANVQIYANNLYGSGATAVAIMSPIDGHGSDAVLELGSRYVATTVKFDTIANENWYYPSSVSFRKIGIIKNPEFANLTVSTSDYDRVELSLTSTTGSWVPGEIVVQATANAAGLVMSGNSTVLKVSNVQGTFAPSQMIYGYISGTSANTSLVTTIRFTGDENIVQTDTGASFKLVSTVANTLYITDVIGQLANNLPIVGSTSGAAATVSNIQNFDGTRNLSGTFARRFNQTARLTFASIVGTFSNSEIVTQSSTGASGRIIDLTSDLDVTITGLTGSFSIGDTVTNSNTSANGKVIFANSSYIKMTGVSNSTLFSNGNIIQNGLGAGATVNSAFRVAILSDVSKSANFANGFNFVVGAMATGLPQIVSNPDLIRETGKVFYTETSNSVINKSLNTTEEIRLIIKF